MATVYHTGSIGLQYWLLNDVGLCDGGTTLISMISGSPEFYYVDAAEDINVHINDAMSYSMTWSQSSLLRANLDENNRIVLKFMERVDSYDRCDDVCCQSPSIFTQCPNISYVMSTYPLLYNLSVRYTIVVGVVVVYRN